MISINVRTSLHLWLLSGRSGDFYNTTLNNHIAYAQGVTPPLVREARELLRLDDTRSDFYVLGAVAAVYSTLNTVSDLPDESRVIFDAASMSMVPVTSEGASMYPETGTSWPDIDGSVAGREGFTEVTIERVGASTARVSRDDGFSELVNYGTSGDLVLIEGLKKHGISSTFKASDWEDLGRITLNIPQTSYPYSAMVGVISNSEIALRLMHDEGMMEVFSTASSSIEKLGALAVAIMTRMWRHINSADIGINIEVAGLDSDSLTLCTPGGDDADNLKFYTA